MLASYCILFLQDNKIRTISSFHLSVELLWTVDKLLILVYSLKLFKGRTVDEADCYVS